MVNNTPTASQAPAKRPKVVRAGPPRSQPPFRLPLRDRISHGELLQCQAADTVPCARVRETAIRLRTAGAGPQRQRT
jgi:hypothetical protein